MVIVTVTVTDRDTVTVRVTVTVTDTDKYNVTEDKQFSIDDRWCGDDDR